MFHWLIKLILGNIAVRSLYSSFPALSLYSLSFNLLFSNFYLLLATFPLSKLLLAPYNSLRFHCVKSVQIRSFFWSVFSCIRTRRNSVFCYYVTKQSCYKFPKNTTCIDLLLTNHPHSLLNFCVFETSLSDFHKMTVTVMKAFFQML